MIGDLANTGGFRARMPAASGGVLLTGVATRTAHHVARTGDGARRAISQIFTPGQVARYMAGRATITGDRFTFIDAGAGVGVLTAAMCERISGMADPRRVVAELYETDVNVLPVLRQTVADCRDALAAAGHHLEATIVEEDFVLRRSAASLYMPVARTGYADVVIMNPPYAKLAKDSAQARAFAEIVHGQPNMYALFMAAAVELLRPEGELIAITPRSFCNGLYFREFRRWLLSRMSLRHVHMFESRRATFKDSDVLQESIITVASKQDRQDSKILLSVSHGADIDDAKTWRHSAETIINSSAGDCVIRLPAESSDLAIIKVVESWAGTFAGHGLRISTGPVVTFRATDYLLDSTDHPDAVPLISIHNVRPFATVWPVAKGSKPIAIKATHGATALLLPARNYVLLRRFSAKEEERRLTASPYLPSDDERRRPVAFENHVNYVTHTRRELTEYEVNGLVAIFNSALLDRYFRVVSGNTQVNATEIRAMPFPDLETIGRIGKHVDGLGGNDRDVIDSRVLNVLGVPPTLMGAALEVGS